MHILGSLDFYRIQNRGGKVNVLDKGGFDDFLRVAKTDVSGKEEWNPHCLFIHPMGSIPSVLTDEPSVGCRIGD